MNASESNANDGDYRHSAGEPNTGAGFHSDLDRAELLTTALNAAANAIVITDVEGIIEWANPAFEMMSGYRQEEVIGRNPRDLVRSGHHQREFYGDLWRTILSGRVWRGEMLNRRKDGSLYMEEMTITPMLGPDGSVSRFIAVKQDVTERRKHEDKISEQAQLLDRAKEAIIVRNLNHEVTYWNEGARKVFGWTRDEVMGRSTRDLINLDGEAYDKAFAAVMKHGSWRGVLRVVRRNGDEALIDNSWSLLWDADRNPVGVLVIGADVTVQKRLEEQLALTKRMESVATLAGGMAHDLNNLLAPIVMCVDLLKSKVSDPEVLGTLEIILSSARRGEQMVKQVLSFAKGGQGDRVDVDVNELVVDLENLVRATFPDTIAFEVRAEPQFGQLKADPTQLHQLLLNLMMNARDAMPTGGELVLSVERWVLSKEDVAENMEIREGPYLVFEVSDSGCGMAQDVIDRAFDPFFTTKEFGKGSGLGLSTCRSIAKGHGGFITIKSEPGKGTTVAVALPLADAGNADAK